MSSRACIPQRVSPSLGKGGGIKNRWEETVPLGQCTIRTPKISIQLKAIKYRICGRLHDCRKRKTRSESKANNMGVVLSVGAAATIDSPEAVRQFFSCDYRI